MGLPSIGERRVPGLRRGEVASLAGLSVEYYSRLERGGLAGVSPSVLEALTRALRLDDAERAHLFDLALAAGGTRGGARPSSATGGWTCSPSTTWAAPCTRPSNARSPGGTPNVARYTFLDEDSRRFYPRWEEAADICVAILHAEAGRDPHDKLMHDLVGELSTRSPDFRRRWSGDDVRTHGAGTKLFHHEAVGDLALAYESVDMVSEPGLTLTVYAAQPGSPTEERLRLLASWALDSEATGSATPEAATTSGTSGAPGADDASGR